MTSSPITPDTPPRPGGQGEAADPALWQALMEQAPVAMALMDDELNYQAANHLWHKLLGQPPGSMLGRSHSEVIGGGPDALSQHLKRALSGRTVAFTENAPDNEAPHQWLITPRRAPDGAVVGVALYCHLLADAAHSPESARTPEVGSAATAPGSGEELPGRLDWRNDTCPAVTIDLAGNILHMNPAAQGIRMRQADGSSSEPAKTTSRTRPLPFWLEFADAHVGDNMRAALELLLNDQARDPVALPPTSVPSGGQPPDRRFHWSASPVRDSEGRIVGAEMRGAVEYLTGSPAASSRDDARRRHLERRIAELEEEVASLRETTAAAVPSSLAGLEWLNSLPMAALVLQGDEVRQWNRACGNLLGWPGSGPDEAGPRDHDAPPTIGELIQQRSTDDRHRTSLLKQWRTLEQQGGGLAMAFHHPRRGQQELWLEVSPIELQIVGELREHDPDERHQLRLLLIRDITEERVQQAALRSSEHRLRAIVHHWRSPLLITDPGGRVLDCNPAFEQLCGHSRAELVSMEWSELLAQEHWQRCQAVVRDLDERRASYGTNVLRLLDESQAEGPEIGVDVILIRDQWDQLQHLAYLFGSSGSGSSTDDRTALDRQNNNRQIRNGLSIIHTLLDLQWHSTSVGAAREALKASQNRVRAILETFQDGSMNAAGEVAVTGLMRALVHRLAAEAGWSEESHQIAIEGDSDRLPLERTVPVALIVNELAGFLIGRAAPVEDGSTPGHLSASWRLVSGGSKLVVAYEGAISNPSAPVIGSGALGLRIAGTLAEQLGGELRSDFGPPIRMEVDLPHLGGDESPKS